MVCVGDVGGYLVDELGREGEYGGWGGGHGGALLQCFAELWDKRYKKTKTYNSWDSLVVTHPTTNQPISSLCMAERTGCPVILSLWSYVEKMELK